MNSQQPDLFSRLFNSCLESLGLISPPNLPNPSRVNLNEIYAWAKAENIQLHTIADHTGSDTYFRNEIHVFYPTDQDFKRYREDGTSERLQQRFIEAAKAAGSSEQAIERWSFSFDSYEELERRVGGFGRNYYDAY